MSQQHQLISILETVSSTFIGLGLALIVWFLIRYSGFYDINTTPQQGLEITFIFTTVSLLRGYALRRFYNWQHDKLNKLAKELLTSWRKSPKNKQL